MKRGLSLNLALSVSVTLALLAALEVAARLVERRRAPRKPVADYIWNWDDMMPGGFYVVKNDAAGWPPWEEINVDGLRDRTRPHEKPDGVERVVVLGDSVALGAEIRPDQAFPQLLEARLQAEGRPIEVMNVALWGWSTRQERVAWQRIARGYHPDAAILAVCLNDIPELFNNLERPPRWLTQLHERSALVRLVVNAEGREIDSVERLFTNPDARRVREAERRFFAEVQALRAEVEKDGASFAMIVFPFRFQVEPRAPKPVVQEKIASFCGSERLRCLDLLPELSHLGSAAFVDYDHLSPRGAELVAEAVLRSGLLPRTEAATDVVRRQLASGRAPGAAEASSWLASPARSLSSLGAQGVASLLSAPESSTRLAAVRLLERAAVAARPFRQQLARALRSDGSTGVRAAAAGALAAIEGRAASPALLDALEDSSEAVRHEAARALARIGLAPEAVPRLARALASGDDYVSAFAAWTLGNLGEAARPAVPALARALSRDRTDAVVAAALARIGPAASDAVPVLLEALGSASADRRWRAARTLGRIGAPAGAAVPALATALADANGAVRLHSARALGRIGTAARPAAAALQRATGDADASVRREARQALERLQSLEEPEAR